MLNKCSLVSQVCPWCPRRRLPILYHDWYYACFDRCVCYRGSQRHRRVPHPDCYSVSRISSSHALNVLLIFFFRFAWGLILGIGLVFLPDSPRYFVKRGHLEKATESLARLRGQPQESEYIQWELAEIVANEEYERALIPDTGFVSSWMNCFSGSLWQAKSNLRRTILGTSLQMMQQWYVKINSK
jgi:hypothetical protein